VIGNKVAVIGNKVIVIGVQAAVISGKAIVTGDKESVIGVKECSQMLRLQWQGRGSCQPPNPAKKQPSSGL
jgi:hypothetical protein